MDVLIVTSNRGNEEWGPESSPCNGPQTITIISPHCEVLQVCLSRVKNLKFYKHEALIDLRATLGVRYVFDQSRPTRGQTFLHHYKIHYPHCDHTLVSE